MNPPAILGRYKKETRDRSEASSRITGGVDSVENIFRTKATQRNATPHVYLRATHAAKTIRVFLRMRHLRFVRIEVPKFGFGFASEDLLAESFASLPNIQHGCSREVRTAGLRHAIAPIHFVMLY